MFAAVNKSVFSGSISICASKSETMRAVALAALADGTSEVRNILPSPDTYAMIEGIRAFGIKIIHNNTTLIIEGGRKHLKAPKEIIDVGNSGLALRFILAFACMVEEKVCITGDESVRTRRVVTPLLEAYKKGGLIVESFKDTGYKYLSVEGKLKPGVFEVNGRDSQIVSSLLISTVFLEKESLLIVQEPGEKPWVDLTIHFLKERGAVIEKYRYEKYVVKGGLSYRGCSFVVGGDYSTSLFPIGAALITGGHVQIQGLLPDSKQADCKGLDIFRQMGASIQFNASGNLEAYSDGELCGVKVNINDCIDVLPILCTVACFAKTRTVITGHEIAKKKESNRVDCIIEELSKMGARIEEEDGCVIVYPRNLYASEVDGCNDHRIAIALIVAGLSVDEETIVHGVECSVKSYPQLLYDFMTCGVKVDVCQETLLCL